MLSRPFRLHFAVCPNPAPDTEEYGSGEEALSTAAAASREGNPKKTEKTVGNDTSFPGVYLLRKYFSITPLLLSSFLDLSIAVSICNAPSLEVSVRSGRPLKPSSLSQSFHDTVLLVVSPYLSGTTPISASVHLICFCALEHAASSFSLHPLCHSITLANHRLSLPNSSTPAAKCTSFL